MAYPTTLALITALWSGPGRTKSIALWSALGGAIAALGPLLSGAAARALLVGLGLPLTLPLAVVALVLACVFVPAHVNETTEPVDNLGGILSVVLVGALDPRDQLRAGAEQGHARRSAWRVIALAALIALRAPPAPGAQPAVRPATSPPGRRSGSRPCAGIIVFGSLMGAMFIGQQFLQNVLGYSTLEAGRGRSCRRPCSWSSSRRARPSSSRRAAPGSRCSSATCSAARLPHDAAALEGGHPVLEGRARLRVRRDRRRASRARRPRTRSPARCRSRAPGWPRAPPTSSATSAAPSCSRSSARCSPPATRRRGRRDRRRAERQNDHRQRPEPARRSRSPAPRRSPQQYPQYATPDHRGREDRRSCTATMGLHGRDHRGAARRSAGLLLFPKKDEERSCLLEYHARGRRRSAGEPEAPRPSPLTRSPEEVATDDAPSTESMPSRAAADAVPHFSAAERAARGRAARAEVPAVEPRGLASSPPGARTRSTSSRRRRVRACPELVPIRYGRMLVVAVHVLPRGRGDGARPRRDAAHRACASQLCGDAHLSNFGGFASPGAEARLRPQRLRRDAPGPVRVGREAARRELRGRRARPRLHDDAAARRAC